MPPQPPLVSVVTPVHNGEDHLRECIESVLRQTYDRWDYTIVNNCSTDRTLDIAREYAARDPRIRVHNNETFVRVVASYNNAFRQISADSKYCKAVAADDWLFPECLEQMTRVAEQHPSVAIVGAYGLLGAKVAWDGLQYPSTVVCGRALCRLWLLGGPYVFGAPTALLFRSDIVRSRYSFYNESNLESDIESCIEFLEHHDFGFVHQVLTYSRVRPGSLTSMAQSLNSNLAHNLYFLTNYGPKYLDERELEHEVRKRLRTYYSYLGEQIYKRRGKKFWTFHREKLAAAGHPLSVPRLVLSAMSYALDLVLNPKRTAAGVIARAQRTSAQWLAHRRQSIADAGGGGGKGRAVPVQEAGTPHPRRAVAER